MSEQESAVRRARALPTRRRSRSRRGSVDPARRAGPARRTSAIQRAAGGDPGDRAEHPVAAPQAARTRRDFCVSRPYIERPPRAAYELTAEGRELAGALRLLAHWGARHALPAEAPRHPACGTPLEARWYCPTCDHLVEDEPELEMHSPVAQLLASAASVLAPAAPSPGRHRRTKVCTVS